MREGRGDASKAETVGNGEGGRKEERRVIVVFVKVDRRVGVKDSRNVVSRTSVVERAARRDGHVLSIPDVGVVENGDEEPEEEYKSGEDVCLSPPRSCQSVVYSLLGLATRISKGIFILTENRCRRFATSRT